MNMPRFSIRGTCFKQTKPSYSFTAARSRPAQKTPSGGVVPRLTRDRIVNGGTMSRQLTCSVLNGSARRADSGTHARKLINGLEYTLLLCQLREFPRGNTYIPLYYDRSVTSTNFTPLSHIFISYITFFMRK